MTGPQPIVTGFDGRPYWRRGGGMEAVFVADQRGRRSACDASHVGHALLLDWLDPVRPADQPMARVRLPDGRVLQVHAGTVCAATGLATRRLAPARPFAVRSAG